MKIKRPGGDPEDIRYTAGELDRAADQLSALARTKSEGIETALREWESARAQAFVLAAVPSVLLTPKAATSLREIATALRPYADTLEITQGDRRFAQYEEGERKFKNSFLSGDHDGLADHLKLGRDLEAA